MQDIINQIIQSVSAYIPTLIGAFIILVVMYARSGVATPSILLIVITVVVLLVIGLSFWLGLIDKLTNAFLKPMGKGREASHLKVEKVLHQTGDYSLVQINIGEKAGMVGSNLKDIDFKGHDIAVLAIERGEKTLSQPGLEEQLHAGDRLLCYGKSTIINEMADSFQ